MALLDWRGREIGPEYAERDLHEVFGQSEFRPGQREVIDAIGDGRNVVALMPTGSGKSLCYQEGALQSPQGWPTLVVSPLIALMRDQVAALRQLGVPAVDLHSNKPKQEQRDALAGISDGKYAMVYLAPERLANAEFRQSLDGRDIAGLTVDEAHCISQWGDAFRPDYRMIADFLDNVDGVKQVTAFTATASRKVIDDIIESLRMEDPFIYKADALRPNLKYQVMPFDGPSKKAVFQEKLKNLIGLLKAFMLKEKRAPKPGAALVYTSTRREAESLFVALESAGVSAGFYHAGMTSAERNSMQEDFLRDKLRVLVATTAFGMGVDKPNIRLVLNFSIPGSVEELLQETGRAGRDGAPAKCILFYSPRDLALREYFIKKEHPDVDYMDKIYFAVRQGTMRQKAKDGFYRLDLRLAKGRFTRKSGSHVVYDPSTEINATLRMLDEFGLIEMKDGHFRICKLLERDTPEWVMLERAVLVRRAMALVELSRMIEYAESDSPSQQVLIDLMDKEPPTGFASNEPIQAEEAEI